MLILSHCQLTQKTKAWRSPHYPVTNPSRRVSPSLVSLFLSILHAISLNYLRCLFHSLLHAHFLSAHHSYLSAGLHILISMTHSLGGLRAFFLAHACVCALSISISIYLSISLSSLLSRHLRWGYVRQYVIRIHLGDHFWPNFYIVVLD